MKVTIKTPNITEYYFLFEKEDPIYFDCMWARIHLDHDTYTLTATSDNGDYSYVWHVTPKEPFINLMARLGSEYLLSKISSQSEFRLDESKQKTIENLRLNFVEATSPYETFDELVEKINDIDACTEEGFYRDATAVVGKYLDYESIEVVMEYPIRAISFVKVFTEYLQPLLKQQIRRNEILTAQ